MKTEKKNNSLQIEEIMPQSDLSIEFSCMFCPRKKRAVLSNLAEAIANEGRFRNAELNAERFDAIISWLHESPEAPEDRAEEEAEFYLNIGIEPTQAKKLGLATAVMQRIFAKIVVSVEVSMESIQARAEAWSKKLNVPTDKLISLAMVAEQALVENIKLLSVCNQAFANHGLTLIDPVANLNVEKDGDLVKLSILISRPLEPLRYDAKDDLMVIDIIFNPSTRTVDTITRRATE